MNAVVRFGAESFRWPQNKKKIPTPNADGRFSKESTKRKNYLNYRA